MGILFIILGIVGLLYAIFWVFKYELIVRWFNKWAKIDFVPEKRWNKLLLHGVGAVVGSSLIVTLLSLLVVTIFIEKDTPTSEISPIWGILLMILNFGGVFVYAYLYVRYRVNKRAISKRQAVWEMIYAVLSIYAVAISIYLAILAVYVFLALCVIYFALNIALGRSVKVKTTGLFSTEKELHENMDGTYSDSAGNTYVRKGNKFYRV
ncbi:MAG: hypothetical protein KHW86_09180 [Porphyromonadaceae bacterium]|jgi:membrane protein|nr:hypothetical protein [Porphyromonadaceae bacterium]MDY5489980.1 hypothetical protein [Butyricimonas virosa]